MSFFTERLYFLIFGNIGVSHVRKNCRRFRLYNTVNDSLIVFAIISAEKPEVVKKDKVVLETSLPFYYVDGVVPNVFKGELVPRTFIIGKKGEIIIKEIGAAAWDDEKIVMLIDSLKAIP